MQRGPLMGGCFLSVGIGVFKESAKVKIPLTHNFFYSAGNDSNFRGTGAYGATGAKTTYIGAKGLQSRYDEKVAGLGAHYNSLGGEVGIMSETRLSPNFEVLFAQFK